MRDGQIDQTRRSMRRVIESASQLARSAAHYIPYGPIDAVASFTDAVEDLSHGLEEPAESSWHTVEGAERRLRLVSDTRGVSYEDGASEEIH